MARVTILAGCHTQAKSLPTLYKRIEEAISLCLEVAKKRHQKFEVERFIGVQQIPVMV